ncbi:MAG: hypothetical protein Fues2KO_35050 [Fuerstiella sp.]
MRRIDGDHQQPADPDPSTGRNSEELLTVLSDVTAINAASVRQSGRQTPSATSLRTTPERWSIEAELVADCRSTAQLSAAAATN